ncbi:putative phage terminase large subunit [Acaryochloris phage A-HIS1]|nr:putative phage terminase large subunit [Acaryochloris phage A-HIS1]
MRFNHYIGSGFDMWTSGTYTGAQRAVMKDFENSFILLSGSYRSGKSLLMSRLLIRHCMVFPNARAFVVRQHLKSVKKSTLLTVLAHVSPDWVANWDNGDLTLRFHNGSTIQFLGAADPDRIGSIEASMIVVDEAHEISEEAFGMLQGRLSTKLVLPENVEEIDPVFGEYAKAAVNNNQIILACNPKSKSHWLYKNFIENPKPSHVCYQSNSIENVNLPENYLLNNLSAYVRDGKRFGIDYLTKAIREIRGGVKASDGLFLMPALNTQGQRNLLGQWVASEGLIFDVDERDHFVSPSAYQEETKGLTARFYGGIDWGFQNPRIVILEYYEEIDKYFVTKFWNISNGTPDDMIEEIARLTDEIDVERWFMPPDQPGLIKKAKLHPSIGSSRVRKAKNAVLPGIDAVYTRFAHRELSIVNDGSEKAKLCWDEITGYEWKADRNGERKDEPVKERDHYPDAIRYAIYTLDRKRRKRVEEPEEIRPGIVVF